MEGGHREGDRDSGRNGRVAGRPQDTGGMEGTGSAELSKCCRLCPGLSLQHPQIPVWTEAKHPGTNPTFVPFPLSFGAGESQEMKALERGSPRREPLPLSLCCSPAPVPARAWNIPWTRPHRGATKRLLSPRFSPSRGGCGFFLPSLRTRGMQTPAPSSPSSLQMLEPARSRSLGSGSARRIRPR